MRVVDLFGGIGGFGLGWAAEGHDVVASVEKNPYCAATYAANAPKTKVFGDDGSIGDVMGLQPDDFRDLGPIDVVIGGPPCQAFSIMGQNRPDDPRALLIREFVRLAIGVEPSLIVMENVPGILRGAGRCLFDEAREAITRSGYRTAVWDLDASNHGTPQRRRRVFLIAVRGRVPAEPIPSRRVTVADAMRDLPSLLPGSPWPVPPSSYARLLGASTVTPNGHVLTIHRAETTSRLDSLGFGQEDQRSGMRRLSPNSVSWTLRASSRTMTACRPVHPYEPRVVTPREAARLSGFRDDFSLSSNIAQAIADVGNAVPPPLARAVARALSS